MPHFYVKPENIKNGLFSIDGEQVHYLSDVRRFKTGDELMIFDGLGNSYKTVLTSADKKHMTGKIISFSYQMPEFIVNLYTAIPKGDRFEWLIEKCGELGISNIIPINTKRSVITSFSENKSERFEKISVAASSQCGRNDIMKIEKILDFHAACQKAAKDENFITILPWESASGNSVADIFSKNTKYKGANIFIGPEGGFETDEVDYAVNLGIKTVTLGNNILRVETAALAASVLVLNYGKGKDEAETQ
ncbi:MAG: 16S rRNA (uracil(1498)-N(3))-methyltransferase [Endomicrobia bacterium]|nr:16S rRNA (uracil(1498)-N(3))-methyltransferase [Endomicrobiia bacterium]MCL2506109.1 16S rRNA (uracil(1498)-N(3))-methyltransferase [Endomicrobiia bacterium]